VKENVISQEVQASDNHPRVSVNLHTSSKALFRKSINVTVRKAIFFNIRKNRLRECWLEVERHIAPKTPVHLSYLNPHCLRWVRTNFVDGSIGVLLHCYSRWRFHYSTSMMQNKSKSYLGHSERSVDLEKPGRKMEDA
jgi:hypothetical protein